MRKRVCYFLILIFIIFFSNYKVYAIDFVKSSDMTCTLTKDYVKWSKLSYKDKKKYIEPIMCEEYYQSSISSSINYSAKSGAALASTSASYFNLRDLGYSSDPFVGFNYNMCWSFSSNDSVESSYMIENNKSTLDLSEMHLGLSTLTSFDSVRNSFGYYNRTSVQDGGNNIFSSNYYARRIGPVYETSVPLSASQNSTNASKKNELVVESIDLLSFETCSSEAITMMKNLLVNYGALSVAIYYDSNYYKQVGDVYSYYYNGSNPVNHAISIIGWDDNYSASNFTGSSSGTPSGNGAWIAQDNQNVSREKYYISYYDSNICKTIMGTHNITNNVSDNSYSYSYSSIPVEIGFSSSVGYFSTKFNTNSSMTEKLDSVVVETLYSGEVHEIYYSESNSTTDGILLGSVTADGWGYRSINVSEDIYITGDYFYIIDKVTSAYIDSDNDYHYLVNGYSDDLDSWYYKADDDYTSGVSFYSNDNQVSWYDSVSTSNIKFYNSTSAFTSDVDNSIAVSSVTTSSTTVNNSDGYYEYSFSLIGLTFDSITTKIYKDSVEVTDKFTITKNNNKIRITVKDGVTESGSYTVTFTSGSYSVNESMEIIDNVINATSISIDGSSEIAINGTTNLTVTFNPSNVNNTSLTWSSSNPDIATVSDDGVVTGVSEGYATITATTTNNVSGNFVVNVIDTTKLDDDADSRYINNYDNDSNDNENPKTGSVLSYVIVMLLCSIGFIIFYMKRTNNSF